MSLIKYVLGVAIAVVITACGGGGGSPGTTGKSTSGTAVVVPEPTLTLTLVDVAGVEITDHVLSQTRIHKLKIVLKNTLGVAVGFTRVAVTLDSPQAVLVPSSGAQLTDDQGVVLMPIAPANVNSSGVVVVTAKVDDKVDGITVASQTYSLQIVPGTVGLSKPVVSTTSLEKGQSINASVNVTVNGLPATSNSVAVTFASLCGTVSPASALVDSTGVAAAVIQTNNAGNCTVTASVGNVTSPPATFTVTSPPITGIQFVSAAPVVIYQAGSSGVNTSIVKFKVIDSQAAPVQGINVQATLTNSDGGINFCNSPSLAASGSDGVVTFAVCGGTLPATVQVRAQLVATPAIFTNSNLLTVQTGLPTQRFFDISATSLNFFAGGYFTNKFNGNTTDISVFAADRQGNPVPNGTKIVFVSEGGQINSSGQSSCLISGGSCTVSLIGQDYRPMGSNAPGGDPRPGRVTVLAYADGEEYFVDANNNNRYEKAGDVVNGVTVATDELFEDLGTPYVDKDESLAFDAVYTNMITNTNEGETTYPTPLNPNGLDSKGTTLCPSNSNLGLSQLKTCNGRWDSYTKVRRSIVIVFSGDEIGQPGSYDASIPAENQTEILNSSNGSITVRVSDRDGNPLPSDAAISAEVFPSTSTCKATVLGSVIGNSTEPTQHAVSLDGCNIGISNLTATPPIVRDSVLFKVTVGKKVTGLLIDKLVP